MRKKKKIVKQVARQRCSTSLRFCFGKQSRMGRWFLKEEARPYDDASATNFNSWRPA